jgi:hypothetical protein
MPFTNNNGQTRVGVRISPLVSQVTTSSLWNSIYSVYNADSVGSSSLKTSLYAVYNGELNTNDSYGSNNGTEMGGLTYSTGKIGNAFQFNGTNAYVSLPRTSNEFDFDGDFSISVWIKPTANSANYKIFQNFYGTTVLDRYGYNLYLQNGLVRFATYANNTTNIANSSTAIVGNTWYHITITKTVSNAFKMYINGVLQTLTTTDGNISNNPTYNELNQVNIGSTFNNGSRTDYFNGQIDVLNIWQKELTASEVSELYNSDNGSQYIGNDFYKPTTSDAVYLNNGTVVGGLTYIPGKVGTAFQFNGTNAYVDLPNNSLNLTGDFSISLWYYTTVISGEKYIVSNYIRPTVGSGFILLQSSNRIGINIYGTSQINLYTNVNTIAANTWYHVTVTRKSGNRTRVYLNGVLSASNTSTVDPIYPETSYPTAIGADPGYGGYVNGRIDALNIWNRELTESDVTELYNSGDGVQYSNPLSPLLLDSYYGAAAAYSLRKLKNSWTGSAIKVRRSNDNVEGNIGFDAGGNLDTTSLLSFVGANNTSLYSEELDNANWSKGGITVTTNQTTAPDGTMTADLVSETATSINHGIAPNYTSVSFPTGTSWNMSVYVKKGPGTSAPDTFALSFNIGGTSVTADPLVLFSFSTGGAIETYNPNNDANFGYSMESVGDGWFRCAMWGTLTITENRVKCGGLRLNNNLNTITSAYYIGNVQSNMYIWGWQFVRALNNTSVLTTQPYTKTTATEAGNGFVTTWYDQSGNVRNATQSTATNQPQIVSNGSLVLMNNKPSVSFTTSNMTFTQIAGVSGLDIFVVSNFTNVTGGGQNWNIASPILAETSGSVQDFALGAKSSKMSIWAENNNNIFLQTTATISINTPYIYNGYGSSTSVGVGFNGGNYVTGTGRRNDLIVRALGKDSTSIQFTGNLSEVIVYTSIQSSNRPSINSEINSFYSIY